jgi:hypothetical protein
MFRIEFHRYCIRILEDKGIMKKRGFPDYDSTTRKAHRRQSFIVIKRRWILLEDVSQLIWANPRRVAI